jgi:putative transposase
MNFSLDEKRALIEENAELSIREQCILLELSVSSYYYVASSFSEEDERLMALLDEHYLQYPCEGKIKRAKWLSKEVGYPVGKRRVKKLMEKMGLSTVYPKPNTSVPNKEHEVFPYLLRDVNIIRPNQVWAADITYIRMKGRHVYLVAIMDWYSRYVINWSVSPNMEAEFCVEALRNALLHGRCDVFNTDQGSQFTSKEWINTLKNHGISISMDGRGRYLDNIFIERLWRSVKQEKIYRYEFETIEEVELALTEYFDYYNNRRPHQSFGYLTPAEVFYSHEKLNVNL